MDTTPAEWFSAANTVASEVGKSRAERLVAWRDLQFWYIGMCIFQRLQNCIFCFLSHVVKSLKVLMRQNILAMSFLP